MSNFLKLLATLVTLLLLTFVFFNMTKVIEAPFADELLIRNSIELDLLKQKLNQEEIVIAGKLRANFYDNFDTGESEVVFYIEENGKEHQVFLDEHDGEKNINNIIEFRGLEVDGKQVGFVDKVIEVQSRLQSIATNTDIEVYKTLVLLVDFNDSHPLHPPYVDDSYPLVQVDTLASHLNTEIFDQYFQEVFEGKVKNKITRVEDWFRLNRDCGDVVHDGYETRVGYVTEKEIEKIMLIRNIDHTKFDNISIISNCLTWKSWGIAQNMEIDGHKLTVAKVIQGSKRMHFGFPDSLIPGYEPDTNGTIMLKQLIHERAHNFGIMHSHSLDCRNSQYLYPCPVIRTYGNPHDLMGGSRGGMSLNAYKLNLHGIKGNEFYHYVSEDGIYELDPLKAKGADKKIGIFIHSEFAAKPVFMLENRTAIGVDKQLIFRQFKKVRDGAVIYSSISRSRGVFKADEIQFPVLGGVGFNFIDADTADGISLAELFIDRAKNDAITPDNSFFDPMTGIRIEVLEPEPLVVRKSSIRVRVTYDDSSRMCFKSLLKNQVDDAYFYKLPIIGLLTPSPGDGAEYPVIKQGEKFKIQFETHQANDDFCPREKIKVFVKNAENFHEWILPVSSGGGVPVGRQGGPTGKTPVDPSGSGVINLYTTVSDINKLNILGGVMEIADSAPLGKHIMHVVYENIRTGEAKTSVLKFEVRN